MKYYRKFYHYNADENQDETSHRSTDEEIEYTAKEIKQLLKELDSNEK